MDTTFQSPQPVYVNFFFHFEDFINRELSQPAIRRLVEIYIRNNAKCDIYYTGIMVNFLAHEAPETLALLRKMHMQDGYGLGYHGDIHGPNTTPYIHLNTQKPGLNEGVEWCVQHESHLLDPLTGESEMTREGGLLLHDRLLGAKSMIGVATNIGPQWILALKKLGIKMQLGGEWKHKQDPEAFVSKMDGEPLAWWMGSLKLFDTQKLTMLSSTASFDELFANLDRSHPNLITVVGHDCDMYQNALWAVNAFGGNNLGDPGGKIPASFEKAHLPPEKIRSQEQQEAAYQKVETMLRHVLSRVKSDPSLKVVTAANLYDLVKPPVLPSYPLTAIFHSARMLAQTKNWQHKNGVSPPDFIRLPGANGSYLSLAEFFGVLCASLAYYKEFNKFPVDVSGRDLLGPTELVGDFDSISSLQGEVSAPQILEVVERIFTKMIDRVPLNIYLDISPQPINTAEFLYLMALLVTRLEEGELVENISVPLINSHLIPPLAAAIMEAAENRMLAFPFPEDYTPEKNIGRLSLQQMWALKPAPIISMNPEGGVK